VHSIGRRWIMAESDARDAKCAHKFRSRAWSDAAAVYRCLIPPTLSRCCRVLLSGVRACLGCSETSWT